MASLEVVAPRSSPAPAIVVLTPIFGLEPGMRETIERYAAHGYLAVAPDLFARTTPGPLERDEAGTSVALARKEAADPIQTMQDLRAVIESVRAMPECNGHIAVAGFCFGGRYAFLAAAQTAIDAAIAFHPTEIGKSLEAAAHIKVPTHLHFGGRDPVVPMSEVRAIESAIANNSNVRALVHPLAKHSFAVPRTSAYDAQITAVAERSFFELFPPA